MLANGDILIEDGHAATSEDGLFKVVVVGEFNSGKSSVINLMLRRGVLPASAEFTNMPPARIVLSDQEEWAITGDGGSELNAEEFRGGKLDGEDIENIEISLAGDDLSDVSVTEVSVDLDGFLSYEAEDLINGADLVIWCTMGQRAWCLSEIDIVKEFPSKIHKHAILVITRADLLPSKNKKKLVTDRVEGAAAEFFDKVFMVECGTKAIAEADKSARWKETGGQALWEGLVASVKHVRALPPGWEDEVDEAELDEDFADEDAQMEAAEEPVAEEIVSRDNVVPLKALEPITPTAPDQPVPPIMAKLNGKIDEFVAWIDDREEPVSGGKIVNFMEDVLRGLSDANEDNDKQVAQLLDLAKDAMTLIAKEPSSEDKALRCLDMLIQLETELTVATKLATALPIAASRVSRLVFNESSEISGRTQVPT